MLSAPSAYSFVQDPPKTYSRNKIPSCKRAETEHQERRGRDGRINGMIPAKFVCKRDKEVTIRVRNSEGESHAKATAGDNPPSEDSSLLCIDRGIPLHICSCSLEETQMRNEKSDPRIRARL